MLEKKQISDEDLEKVSGGVYDEDPLSYFKYYDVYKNCISIEELVVGKDYLFARSNILWYFGTFMGINRSNIENDNGMIVRVKDAYKSFDGFAWDFDTVLLRFHSNYQVFTDK